MDEFADFWEKRDLRGSHKEKRDLRSFAENIWAGVRTGKGKGPGGEDFGEYDPLGS